MVVGKVVSGAASGHGDGHPAVRVLEAHEQSIVAVVDGEQAGEALAEVFFDDGAVDLLGDSAAEGVVEVLDEGPVGEAGAEQLAAGGVVVGGDVGAFCSGGEEAVEVVLVGGGAGGEQVVLVVVAEGAPGDAAQGVHLVVAGAVGVVAVFLDEGGVLGDGEQPSHGVVGVDVVDRRAACGLGPAGDAAGEVAGGRRSFCRPRCSRSRGSRWRGW